MTGVSSAPDLPGGAAVARCEADRLWIVAGDGWGLGSRVLIARWGPSGDVGPLRRDGAAASRSRSAPPVCSVLTCLLPSPPRRVSLVLMVRDCEGRSSAPRLPDRGALLLSVDLVLGGVFALRLRWFDDVRGGAWIGGPGSLRVGW